MVKLSRTIFIFLGLSIFGGLAVLSGLDFSMDTTTFAAAIAGGFGFTAEAVLAGLLTDFPAVT
uniref:Uncharacterized protein n=1 Tax=mine drainage metagenome TaxID=410659 RepID=E6QQD0_9ZZZZ